jgi:Sulfotransferase domain
MSTFAAVEYAAQGVAGLPEFFLIGPPRTGTTWLHNVIKERVNLPRVVKETQFFDRRYSKGLGWYHKRFEPIVGGLPIGEVAPTYFYSAQARERISRLTPNARIICTLRDPVERLYSLYRIKCASGAVRCSFREAVDSDRELIESSRYRFHLGKWIELFGRQGVLVLLYESLVEDPQGYVGEICRFIGIPPFTISLSQSMRREKASDALPSPRLGRLTHLAVRMGAGLNANGRRRTLMLVRKLGLRNWFLGDAPFSPPPLDPEFSEQLRERMRGEIEALEVLLQTDLARWKTNDAGARLRPAVPEIIGEPGRIAIGEELADSH